MYGTKHIIIITFDRLNMSVLKEFISRRFCKTLPEVCGNRGTGHLFKGNKGLKFKRAGKERQLWGTGNIGNQNFDLGSRPLGGLLLSF